MATAGAGLAEGGVEKYDSLTHLIEDTFTQYHSILDTQKDKLLERVRKMKELYIAHRDIEEAIKQIEVIKSATNDVVTKNLVAGNKEQVMEIWDDKITELNRGKAKLDSVSDLKFVHNTEEFSQSVNGIHLLGCLAEEYSKRRYPVVIKLDTDEKDIDLIHAIAVDKEKDLVYVTQSRPGRVSVYSLEGDFIRNVGKSTLRLPFGICLSDNFVFVIDIVTDSIVKFSKAGDYVSDTVSAGKDFRLSHRDTLCVYNNQTVYVCNYMRDRIEIFAIDLSYTGSFGNGEIGTPIDIKVRNHTIYVLDIKKKVHSFNTEHKYLNCIQLVGCDFHRHEGYLAIDKEGNFIVNNISGKCWNVYSPSGELIESLRYGYFLLPCGIDIDRHNRIITVSHPHCTSLQMY